MLRPHIELLKAQAGGSCRASCSHAKCSLLPGPVLVAVEPEEGEEPLPPPGSALDEAAKAMQLEGLFLFAMVWSVGATCDAAGRAEFDHFFRCGRACSA